MDLEHLDSETMDQDIHVTETILIHIPNEHQELNMKEEHLDQIITTSVLMDNSIDEADDNDMHEEMLEITKLKSVKKRVSLTIEKKMEIIQRHEKGESQRVLSQEYNVGRTTISDILKRKYKFFKFISMNADKDENLKRRRTLRRTVHKELEDKLLEWYNECRAQGGYVSGPMISARAQELHKELGYTDPFTASNGWLDRFKVRNGIKLCGLREVKSESDINAVAPFKTELESLAQWYNLTLEQVYNADEADLFWKMLPNPVSEMNEVKASVRAYRERMTVLCCANAAGTHKTPLVCIGRGKKSRVFTSHEIKTMPVSYYSQDTAWMDQDIFRDWFHTHFVPSVREHLRQQGLPETALLLIDRSTSHPSDQYLRSEDGFFFCQFFPAKVKSLIQPMEQGIISNMKRHYRLALLTDLVNKGISIAEFSKFLSLKEAIRMISQGWDSVTEDTIRFGFSKIFQSTGSEQIEPNGIDPLISSDVFEKLVRQIPECYEYSLDRIERWLSCDDAEPSKEFGPFKAWTEVVDDKQDEIQDNQQDQHDEEQIDENIVFIDVNTEDLPHTLEILSATTLSHENSTIIEQDSDDEMKEEEEESIADHKTTLQNKIHQPELNNSYEENDDITCKQAVDALNVVLKFMKSDSDSRYKDVVMLQELKKKLRLKLNLATANLESNEYS